MWEKHTHQSINTWSHIFVGDTGADTESSDIKWAALHQLWWLHRHRQKPHGTRGTEFLLWSQQDQCLNFVFISYMWCGTKTFVCLFEGKCSHLYDGEKKELCFCPWITIQDKCKGQNKNGSSGKTRCDGREGCAQVFSFRELFHWPKRPCYDLGAQLQNIFP